MRLMTIVGVIAACTFSLAARADNRINPGLKAVADAATDVVVAEVLTTQPRLAIEGARDNATFKVVRTLKGPLEPGKEASVYYHLLWVDIDKQVLEPPKFEVGKRYTLFLAQNRLYERPRQYELAEQWLAVTAEHPELDKDIERALNEVGDLWSDYWRKQHQRGLRASSSRIEIVPDDNVKRTKAGLSLGVKITNHSSEPIATRLAHEWHGGEWPKTDLYASATHVQAKQPKSLEPVYLLGEESSATALTRIAPGESATVQLRMDWPGTGSVKATPLLTPTDSETNVRILMVFDAGDNNWLEYAASAVKHVRVGGE